MRFLFGPENDHRHTPDPAPPGAYEWWYFDALSEDGRYAVVVILFLGSPMSPYYKAVAEGEKPDPMAWCGVFFTLHEKIGEAWRERAYAYNLYHGGDFSADRPDVTVGASRMTYDGSGTWTVSVRERGLWQSDVRADLSFTLPIASDLSRPMPPESQNADATHAWVCVAPVCRLTAQITVNTFSLTFRGDGYHDHNFGDLPLYDVSAWYWARAQLICDDGAKRMAILYYLLANSGLPPQVAAFVFDREGNAIVSTDSAVGQESNPRRNAYGLTHPTLVTATSELEGAGVVLSVDFSSRGASFSEGPFYRRLPVTVTAVSEGRSSGWKGSGEGIGEIFVPSRLCGPIASRAIWSRMRRRIKL